MSADGGRLGSTANRPARQGPKPTSIKTNTYQAVRYCLPRAHQKTQPKAFRSTVVDPTVCVTRRAARPRAPYVHNQPVAPLMNDCNHLGKGKPPRSASSAIYPTMAVLHRSSNDGKHNAATLLLDGSWSASKGHHQPIRTTGTQTNTHHWSRWNKSRTASQNTNTKNAPSERPLPSPYSPRSPNPIFQTLPARLRIPVSSNAVYEKGTCTIGSLDGGSWRVDQRGNLGRVGRLGEGRDRSRAS